MQTENIVIIYQPGFAGHFLSYLLTLDSSTLFLKPLSVQLEDTPENRLKFYSFNNTSQYDHWHKFHAARNVNTVLPNPKGLKSITSMHPLGFDPLVEYNKLFIVNLTYNDFNNFWLNETKKNWFNFPILRKYEFEREISLRKEYPLIEISLDKFLNPTTWIEEYQKISNLLNLPILLDLATELYNSWYTVRVLPYVDQFTALTDDQKIMHRTARLALEENKIACVDDFFSEIIKIYIQLISIIKFAELIGHAVTTLMILKIYHSLLNLR